MKKQTNDEIEEDVRYIFMRAQLRDKPHEVAYLDRLCDIIERINGLDTSNE